MSPRVSLPPPAAGALVAVPAALAGAFAVAVAAQFSLPVPGSPVPQSLQTLGVVVVGGLAGPRRGAAALLLYLALGAVGLPVFADGGAGAARLVGASAGYLWGFLLAASLVGWWLGPGRGLGETWARAWLKAAAVMLIAHVLVLACGWTRLAWSLGPAEAAAQGVAPFLWGGVVKSAAGAALVVGWWRWRAGAEGGAQAPAQADARPPRAG